MAIVKDPKNSKYYDTYLKIMNLLEENPFYTITDISNKLRISKKVVHSIYCTFGISVRKIRCNVIKRDVEEYNLSYKAIAKMYNIEYNTVSSIYRRATGKGKKRTVGRGITKEDIIQAFKKHKGKIRYASKQLGWNPTLLRKKIEELGIMDDVKKLGYKPDKNQGRVKDLILLKYRNKKPSSLIELVRLCNGFATPSYVRRIAKKYELYENINKEDL